MTTCHCPAGKSTSSVWTAGEGGYIPADCAACRVRTIFNCSRRSCCTSPTRQSGKMTRPKRKNALPSLLFPRCKSCFFSFPFNDTWSVNGLAQSTWQSLRTHFSKCRLQQCPLNLWLQGRIHSIKPGTTASVPRITPHLPGFADPTGEKRKENKRSYRKLPDLLGLTGQIAFESGNFSLRRHEIGSRRKDTTPRRAQISARKVRKLHSPTICAGGEIFSCLAQIVALDTQLAFYGKGSATMTSRKARAQS